MASRHSSGPLTSGQNATKVGGANCLFYMRGMCNKGAQCRFVHPADVQPTQSSTSSAPLLTGSSSSINQAEKSEKDAFDLEMVERALPKVSIACKFYLAGNCTRGDTCRYAHVDASSTPSEDCPICMVAIEPPKQFGLLSDCDHAVCLDCIREWRKSDETNDAKYGCPLCRTKSSLVIPSSVFATGVQKEEIRAVYIARLSTMPCKRFNFGEGTCPFAPNCHYAHVNRAGELVLDESGEQSAGKKRVRQGGRGAGRRLGTTASRLNHRPRSGALDRLMDRVVAATTTDEQRFLLHLYLTGLTEAYHEEELPDDFAFQSVSDSGDSDSSSDDELLARLLGRSGR